MNTMAAIRNKMTPSTSQATLQWWSNRITAQLPAMKEKMARLSKNLQILSTNLPLSGTSTGNAASKKRGTNALAKENLFTMLCKSRRPRVKFFRLIHKVLRRHLRLYLIAISSNYTTQPWRQLPSVPTARWWPYKIHLRKFQGTTMHMLLQTPYNLKGLIHLSPYLFKRMTETPNTNPTTSLSSPSRPWCRRVGRWRLQALGSGGSRRTS